MDHALEWAIQNPGQLTTSSLLLLGFALFVAALGSGRLVLGRTYRELQADRNAEKAGHDKAREALAETNTALAIANAKVGELERDLAQCEGELTGWRRGRTTTRKRP